MKKYSQRILVIVLVISLIANVVLFVRFMDFKQREELEYRSAVNHFYGHFWQADRYLDRILKESNEPEPNLIYLASDITRLVNEVRQADEKIRYMEKYSATDPELEVYRIPSLLFGMYLGYRINHLESAISNRNVEELFHVAEEIHEEYSVFVDNLPGLDSEFLELTEEEQIAIWVEIVKQLPESDELDQFKDFIRFEWLVEEYYRLELN